VISIICAYNNKHVLDIYLLNSLINQTADYEFIPLDNTTKAFKSASKALNHGGRNATGKYLMFIHQDVDLSSKSWLEDAEQMLDSLPDLGIAGVAGVSENLKGISTNLKQGDPPVAIGQFKVDTPLDVQTLDECLVIIPRSVFLGNKFDEDVCDGWHLYAVDYCLSIKSKGLRVLVLPLYVYHRSPGVSLSIDYFFNLGKIMMKHKARYPFIYTTVGHWDTSKSMYYYILKYFKVKAIRFGMRLKCHITGKQRVQ
jgi:hypothetical protein